MPSIRLFGGAVAVGVLLHVGVPITPGWSQSNLAAAALQPAPPLPAAAAQPAAESREHPAFQRAVRLQLDGVPLATAVDEIARQAGLRPGYSPDLLPDRRITLREARIPAGEALARVLRGTGVVAVVSSGGHLVLVAQPVPVEPQEPVVARITGRVTDSASGAPLSGVSVRLEALRRGVLTGADGRYRLENVPAGRHVISASLVGYTPAERVVDVEDGASATADFTLRVSAVPLDQVVVTGTLVPTSLRAVPTPVTLITAEEIRTRNVQRVDEIFRGRVAGAASHDWGAGHYASTIYVRGSTLLTTGISGIKTYVDGIQVTSNNFLSTIDPNSIERIEVIRGPQAATLYGPEAINGVMQIFTKKGITGARPEVRAKVAFGAIQSPYVDGASPVQDHSLTLSGGGEEFSYHMGGSYQSTGEWQPEFASRTPGMHGGVRLQQGPYSMELTTRLGRTVIDMPWAPIVREAGYSIAATPPNERIAVQQQTHGVRLGFQATPAWEHRLTIGQDASELEGRRFAPRLETPADTFLQVNSSKTGRLSASYSTSLQAALGAGVSAVVTAGGDYYRLDGSSYLQINTVRTRGTLTGTTLNPTRTLTVNQGLFSQVVLGFADALHLTLGLRGDWNDNFGADVGSGVFPRLGATYAADLGRLTVKSRAAYGEAIRPPGVGRREGSVSVASVILPNPGLLPERQRGWEAGVDLHLDRNAWLGVTRYDQEAIDLIETVLVDAAAQPHVSQAQNIGRIGNRGWELEGGAAVGPVRLTGTYSITNSTIEQLSPSYTGNQIVGEQLAGVPVHAGGVDVSLALPAGTTLSANLSHRGSWRELDVMAYYGWIFGGDVFRGSLREYLIDYQPVTKLNLGASQRVSSGLDVFARVSNATHNLRPEVWNSIAATGRTVMVGAWLTH